MRCLFLLFIFSFLISACGTSSNEPQPEPYFSVIPNFQQVHGHHWPLGATLKLEIDNPSNGQGIDFGPYFADVVEAYWDPGTLTWVEFNLMDYEEDYTLSPAEMVQPGFIFTLTDTDSGFTKTHVVKPLFVNLVDPVSKTISGKATNDSEIRVDPNPSEDDTSVTVIADSDEIWSATNPVWNIHPYFGGDAIQRDEDDDSTQFQMRLPLVSASSLHNWINFEDFNHNTTVRIKVFRDNELIFEGTQPTDNDGHAWLEGLEVGLNLEVDDVIVATDNFSGLFKTLTIEPVTLDHIDLENDFFSGSAPTNRMMQADVGGRSIEIESDADGSWFADFGNLSPPEGPFNITGDMWPSVRLPDEDFDGTVAELTP